MRLPIALFAALFVWLASPASALDLPSRKPGLWEMKMVFEGRNLPSHTAQHCIDAETDRMMNATGTAATKDMCAKMEVQKVGDTYVVDAVCKMGPSTNTTHSVVAGDFNSAYTVKVSSQTEGGPKLPGSDGKSQMTIEARWVSACTPSQRPGDIIMSNGMKMNVRDMQRVQNFGAGGGQKQ